MKQKMLYGIGISLLAMMCLIGCGQEKKAEEQIPVVRAIAVGMSEDAGDWYAGSVCGRYEKQLAFQVGGKIIARNIEVGQQVSAGQVLLSLDAEDVRQKTHAGMAQVERAEAQERLAEADMKRYRQLYEVNAISKAQYEQVVMQYESARAVAKEAHANMEQLSNMLEYTELTADVNGTVSAIAAEVGQVVAAGQTIVTLVQNGNMEVEIAVPENRYAEFYEGKKATVTFWANDDIVVQGTVREIAPMADRSIKTYRVRIALEDIPDTIRLGMTSRVSFKDTNGSMMTIPLSAIMQSGKDKSVWVVRDGVATPVVIRTGGFRGNMVEVVDGLNHGDIVITAGVKKVIEGQRVRVNEGGI